MNQLIKKFKALSDSNRFRILMMLEHKSLCVCEITFVLNLAVSTVSKHLSILKEAGFILDEKEGKWVNYQLTQKKETLENELFKLLQKWKPDEEILMHDQVQIQKADRNRLCRK